MTNKPHHVRERITWTPEWGKEYAGYAANISKANKWRIDPTLDLEDLIQEAFLIFTKVKHTYPRVIEPRHFMALYKKALINNLHDKASYKHRRSHIDVHLSLDAFDYGVGRIGEVSNAGYVGALIAEMPEELRAALDTLAQGVPTEKRRPYALQPREGLSMQLRRMLRLPINSDPLAIIKRHLITQEKLHDIHDRAGVGTGVSF